MQDGLEAGVNLIVIAALSFETTRQQAIEKPPRPPYENRRHHLTVEPDHQLLCFDFLYDGDFILSP
jgi:hypothetical protein